MTDNYEWWRSAVIYQIYPHSFADSNGDDYGDLPGVISKLPYLRELGMDVVWLNPFYRSPMADAGYDVADYCQADPLFGATTDAHRLIEEAHALGLRVAIDLVPNHTSDAHEWFQAAIAARPDAPERQRYLIRDGRGLSGELPSNNWRPLLGGEGWSRLKRPDGTPEQWYLHLFDVHQPDLDWDSDLVKEGFDDILRHWFDLGVDGFRVDVTYFLVRADGLPDAEEHAKQGNFNLGPMRDQDGVHDVCRRWRKVLEEYDGDRVLVAEARIPDPERLAHYVRTDEMHQAFNFDFLSSAWDAASYRRVTTKTMVVNAVVGVSTTWVFSNHDAAGHITRLVRENTSDIEDIAATDPQPNAALGIRRAYVATLMMSVLPGSAYLYQGGELGLPEYTTVLDDPCQDSIWLRSERDQVGCGGCRIPMLWIGDAPGAGFSSTGRTQLPQPDSYASLTVDRQIGVPGSTWSMYYDALRLRRELGSGEGELTWVEADEYVVVFDNGEMRVLVNVAGTPAPLPDGKVLLASTELSGGLPTDVAVWPRLR